MKRALLTQMRHEWRDNIWLVAGLAIVCTAVWFMSMQIVSMAKGWFYPLGADVDDVYVMSIGTLNSESPDYADYGDEAESRISSDKRAIMANIRKNPYVEAAGFTENGLPYSYSYYGIALRRADIQPKDTIGYGCNLRRMSPGIARVLRLKSRTGKSVEEVEEVLKSGEILVSHIYAGQKNSWTGEEMLGKTAMLNDKEYRVGDVVNQVRRSNFELWGGMTVIPIDESENFEADMVAVRVKTGMGTKFRDAFYNDASLRSHGNVYLTKFMSLEDQGSALMGNENTELRMSVGLVVCLIIIVSLGLAGVFWFRVQQRVSEIAIRKVCGATSGAVFRRILAEGLILLLIAALISAVVGWPILRKTLLENASLTDSNVLWGEVLTVAFMAVGVVISIWIPARKAMKIEPAVAVKDE